MSSVTETEAESNNSSNTMLSFTMKRDEKKKVADHIDPRSVEGKMKCIDGNNDDLWLKKHRPTTTKELAMHATRVSGG